jgi:methylated-DNA-protein-cysteine methyltransferase related protein
MASKNDYFERVWAVVDQIPHGRVTTYGAIAQYLGLKSGARMVGWALNKTIYIDGKEIPAHRVVNRNGELTGAIHFGRDVMRERLIQEGVIFRDELTVDIDLHFWNPSDQLN